MFTSVFKSDSLSDDNSDIKELGIDNEEVWYFYINFDFEINLHFDSRACWYVTVENHNWGPKRSRAEVQDQVKVDPSTCKKKGKNKFYWRRGHCWVKWQYLTGELIPNIKSKSK